MNSDAGTWVDTRKGVDELAQRLQSAESYCLDTEFHRERTYFPQLALIQINLDDEIFIVDPTTVDLDVIATLFDNEALVILHAAQQDLDVLQLTCGTRLAAIFDTQIAAGFIGYSTPSLSALVQKEMGFALPKGDRLTDWLRRPLSDDQKSYAAADVRYLPALHESITRQLDECGRRAWADDACRELLERPSSLVDPSQAWLRVKDVKTLKPRARGVAQSVAQWREERAQRQNIPVRHVLADLALLGIAQRAPRSVEELAQSRGVDGRYTKGSIAREILDAVDRGRDLEVAYPKNDVEEFDRDLRPAATLISAWISEVAARERIETAILGTRADIIDFLRGSPEARLRTGWRADLVGRDLSDLVAGSAGIAFDGAGGLRLLRG
ncbi:MAG: ribonuclease D [Actinomycetota bacterium]